METYISHMTERFIDISDSPLRLSLRDGNLVLGGGTDDVRVLPSELAAVILSHPASSCTLGALQLLVNEGVPLVVCDEKRLPIGTLLPLHGHHLHSERLRVQVESSPGLRNNLWGQVVKAKIRAQGELLIRRTGTDLGLLRMATQVRTGDPINKEALAASRYWPGLMGPGFIRDHEASGANSLLNYGYAVLRALVARALVGSGLHPSLGIHHHNRYDPLCLADDMMEPLRPVVDEAVISVIEGPGYGGDLGRDEKRQLLAALGGHYPFQGESWPLFEICTRMSASLFQTLRGDGRRLRLPGA